MGRVAALWSAFLGRTVTAHEVAWMMVLMKASRSLVDVNHLDNYEDAKGYVDIAESLRALERVRAAGEARDLS